MATASAGGAPAPALAALRARAARPELAPLWDELARRLAASDRPVAAVTLRGLDGRQRAAVADLLGRERLVPATCRVDVAAVAASLGLAGDHQLRALVGELRGPIGNRAEARRRQAAERRALWAWLADQAEVLGFPAWAASLRAAGVPGGDVGRHRARLEAAVGVVRRVVGSAGEPVALAVLAAEERGDPHALDPGSALAPLVLGALAERLGLGTPRSAEEARTVWAAAGVVADELSSKVLVLGLRPGGGTPLGAALGALADAGEPAAVTLAQLRRWPLAAVPAEATVVENPSLVALAAHGGNRPAGSPLVCTSGWPNVAVMTLLRQLATAGTRLRAHADFDPAGILILRHLAAHVGAEPWRMTVADYEPAAGAARAPFDGSVADTPWDPALAAAMRRRRRAVFEEDVAASLLGGGR